MIKLEKYKKGIYCHSLQKSFNVCRLFAKKFSFFGKIFAKKF